MRPILILTVACLAGTTACAPQTRLGATDAVCAPLAPYVAALRRELLAHPETPNAVGEAGTDVVIGFEAACRPRG
jgi:hypothetical protein